MKQGITTTPFDLPDFAAGQEGYHLALDSRPIAARKGYLTCPHCKGRVIDTEHREQVVLYCLRCLAVWPTTFTSGGDNGEPGIGTYAANITAYAVNPPPDAPAWRAGEKVQWINSQKRAARTEVTVIQTTECRVQIEVSAGDGGTRKTWVYPGSLAPLQRQEAA